MTQKCDVCQNTMKMVKKGRGQSSTKLKKYAIRRWQCPVCDNIQTTYGDGWGDNHTLPARAVEEQKRYFKQQEDNQDALNF